MFRHTRQQLHQRGVNVFILDDVVIVQNQRQRRIFLHEGIDQDCDQQINGELVERGRFAAGSGWVQANWEPSVPKQRQNSPRTETGRCRYHPMTASKTVLPHAESRHRAGWFFRTPVVR